jgi:hypothetical protein
MYRTIQDHLACSNNQQINSPARDYSKGPNFQTRVKPQRAIVLSFQRKSTIYPSSPSKPLHLPPSLASHPKPQPRSLESNPAFLPSPVAPRRPLLCSLEPQEFTGPLRVLVVEQDLFRNVVLTRTATAFPADSANCSGNRGAVGMSWKLDSDREEVF